MSSGLDVFNLTDDEAMKLLVCESHIGTKTLDYQMENYVWKRRSDGIKKIFCQVNILKFKVFTSLIFENYGKNCCLLRVPLLPSRILQMSLLFLPWASHRGRF